MTDDDFDGLLTSQPPQPEQRRRPGVITDLACREKQGAGPPLAVADRVQFGVQPAFRASDEPGKSPFLSRLAAVRWALR